jgi:hypothetical protein
MSRDVSQTGDDADGSIDATDGTGRRGFVRGAAGLAAGAVALPALSGVAAAHFPANLDVDVQPGNEENVVDLDEQDHVTVDVYPSTFLNSDHEKETFDPTEREVRYRFGGRSELDDGEGARPVDDGEVVETTTGHGDEESVEVLRLRFPVGETGLHRGDDTTWLFWEREPAGEHGYSGFDTVSVYGGSPESLESLIDRLLALLEGR